MKNEKLIISFILSLFLILSFTPQTFSQERGADPCTGTATDKPCDPVTATVSSQNSSFDLNIKLQNPLKATNIQEAIKLFMGILLKLLIPVIVLMYLWVGLSYILALGNATKIAAVHKMFLYTVIGTLLVLGAWTITNAIVGTINAVVAP